MSTQSQYASIPKLGKVTIAVANTLRDGTGTMGVVTTASPTNLSGSRIDKIQAQALGDTTTGMLRLFLVRGRPGVGISSITFAAAVATVTTAQPHGLTTGDLITVQNAMPDDFNVTNVAVSVLTATTFSYAMATTPMNNATTVGGYSTIKAAEVPTFWRDVPVTAAVVTPRSISTITFVTTTATLTTATPHGLSTGDTVVITGATPAQYNGTFSITVTSPTVFTYTMASAPATNAAVVGTYSVVKSAFSRAMYSQLPIDAGYLPLVLPSGYQLRVATNNAESFSVTATFEGDFA